MLIETKTKKRKHRSLYYQKTTSTDQQRLVINHYRIIQNYLHQIRGTDKLDHRQISMMEFFAKSVNVF